MIDPLVVAFGPGVGVGVLIGLAGVGGGSLMTPLLVLLVGVQPGVAVGTDLIKTGVASPAWTIVAIPALVGLLAFVVHRPRRAEAEAETA